MAAQGRSRKETNRRLRRRHRHVPPPCPPPRPPPPLALVTSYQCAVFLPPPPPPPPPQAAAVAAGAQHRHSPPIIPSMDPLLPHSSPRLAPSLNPCLPLLLYPPQATPHPHDPPKLHPFPDSPPNNPTPTSTSPLRPRPTNFQDPSSSTASGISPRIPANPENPDASLPLSPLAEISRLKRARRNSARPSSFRNSSDAVPPFHRRHLPLRPPPQDRQPTGIPFRPEFPIPCPDQNPESTGNFHRRPSAFLTTPADPPSPTNRPEIRPYPLPHFRNRHTKQKPLTCPRSRLRTQYIERAFSKLPQASEPLIARPTSISLSIESRPCLLPPLPFIFFISLTGNHTPTPSRPSDVGRAITLLPLPERN